MTNRNHDYQIGERVVINEACTDHGQRMMKEPVLFIVNLDNDEDNENSVCVGPRLGDFKEMDNKIDYVVFPVSKLRRVTGVSTKVPTTEAEFKAQVKEAAAKLRAEYAAGAAARKAAAKAAKESKAKKKAEEAALKASLSSLSEKGQRFAKVLATGRFSNGGDYSSYHTPMKAMLTALAGENLDAAITAISTKG